MVKKKTSNRITVSEYGETVLQLGEWHHQTFRRLAAEIWLDLRPALLRPSRFRDDATLEAASAAETEAAKRMTRHQPFFAELSRHPSPERWRDFAAEEEMRRAIDQPIDLQFILDLGAKIRSRLQPVGVTGNSSDFLGLKIDKKTKSLYRHGIDQPVSFQGKPEQWDMIRRLVSNQESGLTITQRNEIDSQRSKAGWGMLKQALNISIAPLEIQIPPREWRLEENSD